MEKESNSPAPENVAVQSDFAQVVEESKKNIQNAEMIPPKARAGRKKLPRDAQGNIIRDAGQRVSGTATDSSVSPGPLNQPSQPAPDISKHLIAPLIGLSKVPANRYSITELALDQDEAKAIAESLNQLYAVFAPQGQMSPKTAAICGVVLTVGSIGFSKYQIYMDKKPQPTPEPEPVENLPVGQNFQTISAEQAFNRNR